MSSGRTHAAVAATMLVAGSATVVCLVAVDALPAALAIPFVGGLINGYIVTPDIDIDHFTEEEARWKRIPLVGGILSTVFATFWYPYALNFSHRGLSHVWLLGTGTRYLYQFSGFIFWTIVFQALALYWTGVIPFQVENLLGALPWALLASWYAGWALQDSLHLIFDWKGWRRMRRTFRRRSWGFPILVATVAIFLFLWVVSK